MTIVSGSSSLYKLADYCRLFVGPRLIEIRQEHNLAVVEKAAQDIKTQADVESEAMLSGFIHKESPTDGIICEEGTIISGTSGTDHYVDPIDGTTNYAAGDDTFGISIGKLRNGVPGSGMIHFPVLGITIMAEEGGGAFINGQPLVIPPYNGDRSVLRVSGDFLPGEEHLYLRLRQYTQYVLAYACFTATALFVAQGKLKAYVHTGATPFDICAAVAIVRAAGGVATGLWTDTLDFSQKRIPIILAANDKVAKEIKELLKAE